MDKNAVVIGGKVVPSKKTAGRYSFVEWAKDNPRHKKFFDEHGFLIVHTGWRGVPDEFGLFDGIDIETGNTVFNASDFEPYEPEK
jgi:hypothetical protein